MSQLAQQVVSGLATGGIFASLALALVLIYSSMQVVNFAQGEMAMLTTFVAWQLTQVGLPLWLAFSAAVAIAFVGGVVLERVIIRPVEGSSPLTIVVVTLGLLIAFNGIAGYIWGYVVKPFPSLFPSSPISIGGVNFSLQDIGIIAVSLGVLGLLSLFLQRTRLGLALRSAAQYPETSRLLGVRVGWMLALGWGMAAAVGAVSGIMVAPVVFLDPNMMQNILVYAFAAAVLGGIDKPLGAVVGGLIVGVLVNLAGTYVPVVGGDMRLVLALALIVVVLLVRPAGLFGRRSVHRV
ncbi:MAG: branched-chain amino acid ABC transporter permease [Candidatus Dormiibacterota bacterium]